MVADSDLPYFRGYTRQRGRGFGALAQTIGRTAIPFLRRYVVPAAKRVGADLLDIAAPEIGNVLTGKKNSNLWLQMLERKHYVNSWVVEKLGNVALFEEFPQKPVDVVELEETFFLS